MIEYNNKEFNCPMELAVYLISGKWKCVILWNLASENLRFNEICRRFPNASTVLGAIIFGILQFSRF